MDLARRGVVEFTMKTRRRIRYANASQSLIPGG
jgi:hypothetical protein